MLGLGKNSIAENVTFFFTRKREVGFHQTDKEDIMNVKGICNSMDLLENCRKITVRSKLVGDT